MTDADRSTIWPYDEHGDPGRFYYSRYDHPTGVAAETELGRRENGDALLYASGMGAATAILLAFARPGTTVALAECCYYATSKLSARPSRSQRSGTTARATSLGCSTAGASPTWSMTRQALPPTKTSSGSRRR